MRERAKRSRRLAVQQLETRKLMAVVSYQPATGEVDLTAKPGEVNHVTLNGHTDRMIIKDQAGIEVESTSLDYVVRISSTEIELRNQGLRKVNLDLADKDDRVVAGGSTVPTRMMLGIGEDVVVSGSKADDYIDGEEGRDDIMGYMGDDILIGGPDDDRIRGFSGDNVMYGGLGDDDIAGGNGEDSIYGGPGNDVLNGRGGADTMRGGVGNDVLRGGSGGDVMHGGPDRDLFYAKLSGADQDIEVHGGAGLDVLYTADLDNVDAVHKIGIEFSAADFLDYWKTNYGTRFTKRDWHDWENIAW